MESSEIQITQQSDAACINEGAEIDNSEINLSPEMRDQNTTSTVNIYDAQSNKSTESSIDFEKCTLPRPFRKFSNESDDGSTDSILQLVNASEQRKLSNCDVMEPNLIRSGDSETELISSTVVEAPNSDEIHSADLSQKPKKKKSFLSKRPSLKKVLSIKLGAGRKPKIIKKRDIPAELEEQEAEHDTFDNSKETPTNKTTEQVTDMESKVDDKINLQNSVNLTLVEEDEAETNDVIINTIEIPEQSQISSEVVDTKTTDQNSCNEIDNTSDLISVTSPDKPARIKKCENVPPVVDIIEECENDITEKCENIPTVIDITDTVNSDKSSKCENAPPVVDITDTVNSEKCGKIQTVVDITDNVNSEKCETIPTVVEITDKVNSEKCENIQTVFEVTDTLTSEKLSQCENIPPVVEITDQDNTQKCENIPTVVDITETVESEKFENIPTVVDITENVNSEKRSSKKSKRGKSFQRSLSRVLEKPPVAADDTPAVVMRKGKSETMKGKLFIKKKVSSI